MAKNPLAPKKPDPGESPLEKVGKEAKSRLTDARAQKDHVITDIEECYFFAAPRRVRQASSTSTAGDSPPSDAQELQTSLGYEVAEDFMTMLIDSFMPQAGRWAERLGDVSLPDAIKVQAEEAARVEDEKIFQSIRASAFHAELAKQGVPDAAIGVIAMMIDDPKATKPIRCIGVAIRELEFDIGPDGRVDFRALVRSMKYRDLKSQLKGVDLPKETLEKIDKEPGAKVKVSWCYWRKWEDDADESWQHVVMLDEKAIHEATLRGEGCCPLIVGRFGAMPDFAWPDGSMIKSLPDLRQIDEMRAAFTENIDFTIRPPFSYPDDGVIDLSDGIEPGMGYPRRPGGTGTTFEKIYEPNPLEAALFQANDLERRVKRLHYVDFPEQQGKTPPTLGQWLDEMVEAQKKIGTPGYAFWREFPYEAFQRFHYLNVKRGIVKPILIETVKGQPKVAVSLQAYNPAQRAQENQEVLTASRLLQIVTATFPQTVQVAINDVETIKEIQKKLGDKLVKLRTPEEVTAAVGQVAQLSGIRGPGAPGGIPSAGQ